MKLKQSDISEILEPVHSCLAELILREQQAKSQNMRYTDADVQAATLLYAHVLSNRYIHYLTEQNAPLTVAENTTLSYLTVIKEITMSMSQVDTSKILKGR